MLTPYPDTLSIEAVKAVAGYFRGGVPLVTAAHAAWDLQGYAMGTALPDLGPCAGEMPKGEDAANVIETLLHEARAPGAFIPWATIIALLLQLIAAYFKR